MSNASTTLVTRCPKCATAFRINSSQLQSAKGSVRCGSCLHVFRAQEHLVPVASKADAANKPTATTSTQPAPASHATPASHPREAVAKPASGTPASTLKSAQAPLSEAPAANSKPLNSAPAAAPSISTPAKPAAPLATRPAPVSSFNKPASATTNTAEKPAAEKKPAPKLFNKSSLDHIDDQLISDEMDEPNKEKKTYEFDDFMEIDTTPKLDVSLFERNMSDRDEPEIKPVDDESWAEKLLDEDEQPHVFAKKPVVAADQQDNDPATQFQLPMQTPEAAPSQTGDTKPKPGLMFSLVGEQDSHEVEEIELSAELSGLPNTRKIGGELQDPLLDKSLFESPDEAIAAPRRQIKTEPKIRAYDSSRSTLLQNIIPAPVEFTAKRMRSWSQQKLWPTLSFIALIALVVQIGWFKFDYFSRVEPYRTGYSYICPLLGCKLPTLVDTSQINAYQVTVRPLNDADNALLVDLMLLNKAPFDQPFPDLVLAFTNMDQQPIASRRFTPKEYLGGELAGRKMMPTQQPIHLSLDLVDPGADAINYHVYIPQ